MRAAVCFTQPKNEAEEKDEKNCSSGLSDQSVQLKHTT